MSAPMRAAGMSVSCALICASVAACASRPTPSLPKEELQQAWVETSTSSTPLQRTWWRAFNDPALDALMTLADRRNLDVRFAEARVKEARAVRGAADAERLPEVNASADIAYGNSARDSEPALTGQIGLQASWEADVFGRLREQANAADAELGATIADRDAARLSVLAEVARSYVEYRLYRVQYALAVQNAQAQERTERITRARFQQGMGSRFDVERAVSRLATTRATVPRADELAESARYRLVLLAATTPEVISALLPEAAQLPDGDAVSVLETPAEVLAGRPDVRAAELRLVSSTASLRSAEALRYPTLSLAGMIGIANGDVTTMLDPGTFVFSLGAGLLAPIFDFGRIRAAIDVADAQQEQAYLQYERTVRTALQESQTAIVLYARGVVRQRELVRASRSAEVATQLARRQYDEGTLSLLEVLDAERSLFDAQLAESEATAGVSLRLIGVYETMGVVPPQHQQVAQGERRAPE